MKFPRVPCRRLVSHAVLIWLSGIGGLFAALDGGATRLPADFVERMVQDDQTMRLTLPNGQQVVGKIGRIERAAGGVVSVQGTLQHPQPGAFAFERPLRDGVPGQWAGHLRFQGNATQWTIQAADGALRLVEGPADEAFRPPAMVMPGSQNTRPSPVMSREDAEAALRKDLKIEQVAPGKLRIGLVQVDQGLRTVRFPATVNMSSGTVEYAVVTTTGKCHEALFATKVAPRDIHLAMLLMGVKPASCVATPDKGLQVPATAAVHITAEWETNGPLASHPLTTLIAIAEQTPTNVTTATLPDRPWLYNGSRFNGAGFAASVEGSIISLIGDEMALINGTGSDRANDEIHVPNAKLLPASGMPVTIVIALPLTASQPQPAKP